MTIINYEELLKPISVKNPTGTNCRQDKKSQALYYQIKEHRQHARMCERKSMLGESEENPREHWQNVFTHTVILLQHHTKDLEILSWLTESLLRCHGFLGLYHGFTLITRMVEHYWDDLFPLPDEDGIYSKIAAYIGLNGEGTAGSLIAPIANVAITTSPSGKSFALWHYQRALENEKITDSQKREHKIKKTGFSLSDIKRAVSESPQTLYTQLTTNIKLCIEAFQSLDQLMTIKCDKCNIPSSNINNALQEVLSHINFLFAESPSYELANTDNQLIDITKKPNNILMSDVRVEYLNQLAEIAEYFTKSEPHSPIPYLLKRAVCWGNLSLPQLLNEIIVDDESRNKVFRLMGIVET